MSDLSIALITIFGTVASVTAVVLYVFNGTRSLIKEMHVTIKEMHATTKEMQKQGELRHREVVEILNKMTDIINKGFRDLSRDVREIKEAK